MEDEVQLNLSTRCGAIPPHGRAPVFVQIVGYPKQSHQEDLLYGGYDSRSTILRFLEKNIPSY